MTNAEKYLKDNVNVEELWENFSTYYYANKSRLSDVNKSLREFMKQETKPTLTEDERVILRNINKKYNRIERNEFGFLILTENGCENIGEAMHTLYAFNHLFQFIKNGEEYNIKELLKNE